jgi:hypothetical protein
MHRDVTTDRSKATHLATMKLNQTCSQEIESLKVDFIENAISLAQSFRSEASSQFTGHDVTRALNTQAYAEHFYTEAVRMYTEAARMANFFRDDARHRNLSSALETLGHDLGVLKDIVA